MSKKILVCGSIAFDTIAVFEDHFNKHILAENMQSLSVSFFVPALRKEYGGCAGNIAYNLHQLGAHPLPVGTVGSDAEDYLAYFQAMGIDTQLIRTLPDHYTAQCFITTDLDNNQIASFHPGAMEHSAANEASHPDAVWGIISPDSKAGMFAHARRLHAQGIPFVFDLGQAMPLFDGDDLREMLGMATILTANDYEASVIEQRLGKTMLQIAENLQAAVVTRGALGATLYNEGQTHPIAATTPEAVVDPTGCGDAHRAGLLYGLSYGWPLYDACCLASIMGGIKVAVKGPQNHPIDKSFINQTLEKQYHSARRVL